MGVGHKDLEHMEAFVLHHFAVIPKQIHANLEVLAAVNVRCHDIVVGAVEQELAEKFNRLALRNVTIRLDQNMVILVEEHVKVDGKIARNEVFVPGQELLRDQSVSVICMSTR